VTTGPVEQIADQFVRQLAAHEPAAAQALGQAVSDRLPDYGPDWAQERRALLDQTVKSLTATGDTGVLALAMTERLTSEAALFDTGFTTRLLAPLACPVQEIRESFDDVVITDDEAGDLTIGRLESVGPALAGLRERLEWSRTGEFSGSGVAPARQVSLVAAQIRSWIDQAYFERLVTAGLQPARQGRLVNAARAATAAFSEFADWLTTRLLPYAPVVDAVGEEVYQVTAQSFLGTPLDLDAIYQFGYDELDRLVGESRRLAAEIAGHTDVVAVARELDGDARYKVRGRERIIAWLAERFDDTIERIAGVAFDLPDSIRKVEMVVPTAATGVVYYTPGAPDGSTPNKVAWTIPEGDDSISTWHDVTSFHHEAVPGHHLEHTVNNANAGLHPWQRYLCQCHGYAEGWAHYSEQLADDLGLIHDPAERLGLVLGQIWRAVRIVADIGLHTGRPMAGNRGAWTVEAARSWLTDLALVDPRTARFEVDRYLAWPGQALAFKVGAKLWGDAAALATAQGTSLKDFHRRALAFGPMGLAPLQELLKRKDDDG